MSSIQAATSCKLTANWIDLQCEGEFCLLLSLSPDDDDADDKN